MDNTTEPVPDTTLKTDTMAKTEAITTRTIATGDNILTMKSLRSLTMSLETMADHDGNQTETTTEDIET